MPFYPNVEAAEHNLEAIDVRGAVYDFYDSLGTRLEGTVDERLGTVHIVRRPTATAVPEELAARLRRFVIRVGRERVGLRDPSEATPRELIVAVGSFFNGR